MFANRREFRLHLLCPLSSPEELRRLRDAFLSQDICLVITHGTGSFKRKNNCEWDSGELLVLFSKGYSFCEVGEQRGPVVRSTGGRGLNVQVIWALLSIDRWGQTGMGGSQHGKEHEACDLGKTHAWYYEGGPSFHMIRS